MNGWNEKLAEQFATLPERLSGHVFLSLTAIVIGIAISVPLGVAVASRPRLRQATLGVASVIQTIPSLALLALMVFAFGKIGWAPALTALVLYSILPILRNTTTGIAGIDPAYLEAARGVGLNRWQSLRIVELPLAAPTILAGVRTAAVWTIGAATIAQPVGATSLGNYIFVGLQTLNFTALLFGCVCSAALALVVDGVLHLLEISTERRSWTLAAAAAACLAALYVAPRFFMQRDAAQAGGYVIGGKGFTEQYILAEAVSQRLRQAGIPVQTRDGLGSAAVFAALSNGEIDCYVDYTGTLWANVLKRKDMSPRQEMLDHLVEVLPEERNVTVLGALGFANDYVFAMQRNDAERLGVESLSDLGRESPALRVGADVEFYGRPEWTDVRDAYGLNFAENRALDAALMYGAIARGSLDVIVAYRTDGRIDAGDLVTLDDPLGVLPPYDAVMLLSERMASDADAKTALSPLINAISSAQMRAANAAVDVEGRPVRAGAEVLLDGR